MHCYHSSTVHSRLAILLTPAYWRTIGPFLGCIGRRLGRLGRPFGQRRCLASRRSLSLSRIPCLLGWLNRLHPPQNSSPNRLRRQGAQTATAACSFEKELNNFKFK